MLAETLLEDKAYYASMDIPVCRPKDPRYGRNQLMHRIPSKAIIARNLAAKNIA